MKAFVLQWFLISLAGGAAAVFVWAVCGLLRKARMPGWLLCLLWGAVALRFALPGGIPLPVLRPSATPLVPVAVQQVIQQAAQPTDILPAALAGPPAAPAAQAAAPWYNGLTVWHLLALVWSVGTAVLLLRAAWGYWRLRQSVALACKTPDGCYTCASVRTPFTLGLLRPRIYLPQTLDGPVRQAILLHERTHVRRGDPLTKPLFYLIVCLHWWNPLAWLAFAQFERAMEAACDEAAVRGASGSARAQYCESLLCFAQRKAAPGSLAFGQGSVKERIGHVLCYRKPGAFALAVCAMVALLAALACMARPTLAQEAPPSDDAAPTITAPAATSESALTPQPTAAPTPLPASPVFLCPVSYTYRTYSAGTGASDAYNDFWGAEGDPVYAAADGVVTKCANDEYYGNYLVLSHGADAEGHTWSTWYAHLGTVQATEGQTIVRGTILGEMGRTGTLDIGPDPSMSCLHFEILRDGLAVPPENYMDNRFGHEPDAITFAEQIGRAPADYPGLVAPTAFTAPCETYRYISHMYMVDGHKGVDFAVEADAPALAVADGVVLEAGYHYSYGNYVRLYHGQDADGHTYATLYAHLNRLDVATGDSVVQGQQIGLAGSTGSSTGNHLHLELLVDAALADPLDYIPY